MSIILASKSVARQNMLRASGIDFKSIPADINEAAYKNSGGAPEAITKELATQKALHVAAQNPEALVVGSDQILECEGALLSKAQNQNEASDKLKTLRGKTHHLISAVCVARDDKILWQTMQKAALTMHNFDNEFLENYLDKAGEALTRSVGAYELESIGVNLFETIEGDYFTILGMPLLPLLTYLRDEQGVSP